MELQLDGMPDIHVCEVLPASTDTPLFQQSANLTGRGVKPLTPIHSAETVARIIAEVAERPRPEVIIGYQGRIAAPLRPLAPGLFDRQVARIVQRDHFTDSPTSRTAGNLFEPLPEYASVSGGWRKPGPSALKILGLVGLAVAIPGLLYLAQRNSRLASDGRGWK